MEKLLVIIGVIALVVGGSLLFAVPVWLLWNMTLISVFPAISSISFGQAFGLTLLSSFLLKSNFSSSK